MAQIKYIHEIQLDSQDEFALRFNECSDLWNKANDKNLSEKERKEAAELFIQKRQCLELGI